MAVEQAFDATTAWVSDVDKGACKILAHRYPDVPNLGDITTIDWATVEPVDIIAGGSPCQDLSHAGKRSGMTEGTRSNLWVAMREAIAQLKPSIVVWENVRGAYSATADSGLEHCQGCMGDPADRGPVLRALGRVLGDLSDLGYDAGWHGLRAADVGAPHGRFRVFVVATARNTKHAQLQRLGPLPRLRGRPTPRPNLSELPAGQSVTLLPTPVLNDMGKAYTPDEWDAWTDKMKAAHGNGNGHGKSLEIEAARLLPTPIVSDSNGAANPAREGHVTQLRDLESGYLVWGDYAAAIARWEHALGRPAPDPTEPTGKNGAHRLSPRFVEWMMGLSDGWITDVPGITRNEALKACGNGVVPQQAAFAISHLIERARLAEVA